MSIFSAPAGALVTLPDPPPPLPPLSPPPPLVATIATITTTTATPRMIRRLFISGASYGRAWGRHRKYGGRRGGWPERDREGASRPQPQRAARRAARGPAGSPGAVRVPAHRP